MVNSQITCFAALSIASHFTPVCPILKLNPDAGLHVTLRVLLEWSEAVSGSHVTTAVGCSLSVFRVVLSGHESMVGYASSRRKSRGLLSFIRMDPLWGKLQIKKAGVPYVIFTIHGWTCILSLANANTQRKHKAWKESFDVRSYVKNVFTWDISFPSEVFFTDNGSEVVKHLAK